MSKKIEGGAVFEILGGGTVTVTKYEGKAWVEVIHNTPRGNTATVNRSNLRAGRVKNPYAPIVVGVGYVGVGKFTSRGYKRIYQSWSNMLKRCYCKEVQEKYPTYIGCTVAKKWHNFQNFAEWYYNHPNYKNKGYQVDKDILVPNNKVYSQQTCTLVPAQLNNIVGSDKDERGGYGIRKRSSGKYEVRVNRFGVVHQVGTFATQDTAYWAHLKARTDHWEEYMESLPEKAVTDQVKEAMRLRVAKFRKLEEERCV